MTLTVQHPIHSSLKNKKTVDLKSNFDIAVIIDNP